jgi:hypothetical protein
MEHDRQLLDSLSVTDSGQWQTRDSSDLPMVQIIDRKAVVDMKRNVLILLLIT